MDSSLADWRGIGAKPVSTENPAGVSVRYDPDFEAVDAQIQRLEGFSRQSVDWTEVVALGRRILDQKSKDILVCSYVAVGLLQTEGCGGLAKGLACLEEMVSGFWPELFPELKRLKARVNALNWLAGRAGFAIAQGALNAGDVDAAAACEARVQSLLGILREKIPVDGPDWTDLLRPLQEFIAQHTPSPVVSAPEAPRPEPEKLRSVPVAAASIDTAEEARRFLQDTIDPLKRAVSISRGGDPSVPAPYGLIRALTWSDIEAAPPASDQQTRVPPPAEHVRERCRTLAAQSAWKELLEETEDRVAEFPFWLDLHRLSDQALGSLGQDYAGARLAIRAETALLLTRLPGLSDLRFSDGTPFADDSTRRWISSELFPAPVDTAAAVAGPGERPDWLGDLRERSKGLIDEGKRAEAISLVQEAARTAPTGRDRFLAEMELARLCLEAGQLRPALARLEMLDEQVRRFSLEEWEPRLSLDALRLYEAALDQSVQASGPSTPEIARQADAVYNRLCRLDVLAGMHLAKATRR